MSSNSRQAFDTNKKDVNTLLTIHEHLTGVGPGRRGPEADVVNKAAIVFITACWESYVEALAIEGLEFLLAHSASAEKLPNSLKLAVTRPLFQEREPDKTAMRMWRLADSSWRAEVMDCAREKTASFHSPGPARINKHFETLLGLTNVSSRWAWRGMPAADAAKKLDYYMRVRGNIAHRTKHDSNVGKGWVSDYLNHVTRLVEKTEGAVAEHLFRLSGVRPQWSV